MRTVVCFQDVKNAALYFDRVLPIVFRKMVGDKHDIVTDFPEPIPSRALVNVVFDEIVGGRNEAVQYLGRLIHHWDLFQKGLGHYRRQLSGLSSGSLYEALSRAYLENATADDDIALRAHFQKYASGLGAGPLLVLLPTGRELGDATAEDPVATVSGLSLINAGSASWEQILELRTDSGSRKKLQRLRAFLTETYVGKSSAYIEDDLARRVDDYEKASKKHGFDLITGSISILLDSESLQAAAAAGVGATLLGGSWLGALSAAGVEVGKVTIEYAKRRRAIVDWRSGHELAYLIEGQRVLKNEDV